MPPRADGGIVDPTPERIRAELNRVLASVAFSHCDRLRQLLRYLVNFSLNESQESPKEYTIATQFFGKLESFDPRTDPIVRVETNRLRRKLQDYYASEGAESDARLQLPKGRYAPVLSVNDDTIPRIDSPTRSEGRVTALAVLPFSVLGGGRSADKFAHGLAEEIVQRVTDLHSMRVYAWQAWHSGTAERVHRIAARFGVDALLHGTVRREGHLMRSRVELLNAADGHVRWSGVYQSTVTGHPLAAEIEAAQAIVAAILDSVCEAAVSIPPRSVGTAVIDDRDVSAGTTPDTRSSSGQHLQEDSVRV